MELYFPQSVQMSVKLEPARGWYTAVSLHDKCCLIAHVSPGLERFYVLCARASQTNLPQQNNHPADEKG